MSAQEYYHEFNRPENQIHPQPPNPSLLQQNYYPEAPPEYHPLPSQVQTPPRQHILSDSKPGQSPFHNHPTSNQSHFMTAAQLRPKYPDPGVYQQQGQQNTHLSDTPTSHPQQYQQYPQAQPQLSQLRPPTPHIRIQEPNQDYDSDSSSSSHYDRRHHYDRPNAYAHLRPSRSYSEPPAPHHRERRRYTSKSPHRNEEDYYEESRSHSPARERGGDHSRHSSRHSTRSAKSTRSKGKRTTPSTGAFFGAFGGGLLGDAILPGLGTLGGALLGGYRGYEVGKGKPGRHGRKEGSLGRREKDRDVRGRKGYEYNDRDGDGFYSGNESERSTKSPKSARRRWGRRDTYEEEYELGRRRRGEI